MYGWVLVAFEAFVTSKYNAKLWTTAKGAVALSITEEDEENEEGEEKASSPQRAGSSMLVGEVWAVTKKYPDKLIEYLVKEVSFVTNTTTASLLEEFGHFFLQHARSRGYDELFRCQGSTFREWLRNVDEVHTHLHFAVGKGGMSSFPEFCCEEEEEDGDENDADGGGDKDNPDSGGCGRDTLILHYKSKRGATYSPFVIGIVKEAAKQYFNLDITFEIYTPPDDSVPTEPSASISSSSPREGVASESKIVAPDRDEGGRPTFPSQPPLLSKRRRMSAVDLRHFSASWRIRGVTDQRNAGSSYNGSPRNELAVTTVVAPGPMACPFSIACQKLSSNGLSDLARGYESQADVAADATMVSNFVEDTDNDDNVKVFNASARGSSESKEKEKYADEKSDDGDDDNAVSPNICPSDALSTDIGQQVNSSKDLDTVASTSKRSSPSPSKSPPQGQRQDKEKEQEMKSDDSMTQKRRSMSKNDHGDDDHDDSDGLSSLELRRIFPFHIQVDSNFRIRNLGEKLRRYAVQIKPDDEIGAWFKLTAPAACGWDWKDFKNWKDATFELELTQGPDEDDLTKASKSSAEKVRRPAALIRLSGGVHMKKHSKNILFLLNPDVESFDDMCKYDLTWSDFPKHSALKKLVYLAEHLKSETFIGQQTRIEAINAQLLLDMKRTFVRYVSHEIRTPLNTVSMGLKLIQDLRQSHEAGQVINPDEEDNLFDMADEIKESCDIAINILNDLLLYEKMEGGLLVLDKKPEPALELVYEAVKVFSLQAREASVDFDCTYDVDAFVDDELDYPTVFIAADRSKISQVLRNLVSNAIKFTANSAGEEDTNIVTKGVAGNQSRARGDSMSSRGSQGSRKWQRTVIVNSSIVISSPRGDDAEGGDEYATDVRAAPNDTDEVTNGPPVKMLRVEVCDSGPGISVENQARLFDEIIQFDPNKLQGGQGSGLGLFISKGIMDLHGGRIGVSSAGEGKGTCFFIEVPIFDSDSGNNHDKLSPASVTPTLHMNSMANSRAVLPGSKNRSGSFLVVNSEGHAMLSPAHGMMSRQRSAAGAFLDEWRDPTRLNAVLASMHSEEASFHHSLGADLVARATGISPTPSISAAISSMRRAAAEKRSGASSNASFPSSLCSSPSPKAHSQSSHSQESSRRESVLESLNNPIDSGKSSRHSSPAASLAAPPTFASLMSGGSSRRDVTSRRKSASLNTSRGPPRSGRFNSASPSPVFTDNLAATSATITLPGFLPGNEVTEFEGKLNILVVDDSIGTRKMIARTLRLKKFCDYPSEACDGAEALALVRSTLDRIHDGAGELEEWVHPFDAILMDFVMPVMDGPTATRLIREEGFSGLIIGVTGNVLPEDKEFFIGKGADAVLTKPLDVAQLATLISARFSNKPQQEMFRSLSIRDTASLVPHAQQQQQQDHHGGWNGGELTSDALGSVGGVNSMSTSEQHLQAQTIPLRSSAEFRLLAEIAKAVQDQVISNSSSPEMKQGEPVNSPLLGSSSKRLLGLGSGEYSSSGELLRNQDHSSSFKLTSPGSSKKMVAGASTAPVYKRGNSAEFRAPKRLSDDFTSYKSPYSSSGGDSSHSMLKTAAGGGSFKGFDKHKRRKPAFLEDIEEEVAPLTPASYRKSGGSSNVSSNRQSPSRSTTQGSIVERVVAGVIRGRVRRLHRSSRRMTSTGFENSGMLATDMGSNAEPEERGEEEEEEGKHDGQGGGGGPHGGGVGGGGMVIGAPLHAPLPHGGQTRENQPLARIREASVPEDNLMSPTPGGGVGHQGAPTRGHPQPLPRLVDPRGGSSSVGGGVGGCIASVRRMLLRMLCINMVIGGEGDNNALSAGLQDVDQTNSNYSRVHPDEHAAIHQLIVNATQQTAADILNIGASSMPPQNVSCNAFTGLREQAETVMDNEYARRPSGTMAGSGRTLVGAASSSFRSFTGRGGMHHTDPELILMASTSVMPGPPVAGALVVANNAAVPGAMVGGAAGAPLQMSRNSFSTTKNGLNLRRNSSRPHV